MDLDRMTFIANVMTKERLFPLSKTPTTMSLVAILLSLGLLRIAIFKMIMHLYFR